MKTCKRVGSFSLLALLIAIAAFTCWHIQLAWADEGQAGLVAGDNSSLMVAEGQNGVLANSWRYENGVPIAGVHTSDGDGSSGALSTQGELIAQAICKGDFGIDVSEWQYDIDWAQVANSVKYAIVRCGYGDDYASQDDKYWLENAKGCQEQGIPMGVYLYSYATDTSMARSEALHVVRCMNEAGLNASNLDLPIYLDLEDNSTIGSDFVAIFETFKSTLAENGYTDVGIYANCNWWRNYLSDIELDSDLRWIAHWDVDDPFEGFDDLKAKGYGVWQFGSATVQGISGEVDGNYKNGAMYRMYNPNSGEHFYTASTAERDHLISVGWNYEGIGWWAPTSSNTPVYRLYNPNAGDHHYTDSLSECNYLIEVGWTFEGIGWYSDDAKTAPLYRQYNPNAVAGAHNFTTSTTERDYLISVGWNDEGIGWYSL